MTKITLDEPLREKLNGLNEQIEVCDEDGNVVGRFLPQKVYERLVYDYLNSQVTDEELEIARNEPGGATLDEVLARLEKS